MQQLEAQLGTRLLQRSTRKLTLISAGEAFHERCAGAVDGLQEAGQELRLGSDEPTGSVRVAVPADFFDFFPMEWIAAFLAAHPRVRLDFVLSDARSDLQAGLLVPVLPQYQRKGQGLTVLYPSRRHLPLAVSAFIALVVDKLGELEGTPEGRC